MIEKDKIIDVKWLNESACVEELNIDKLTDEINKELLLIEKMLKEYAKHINWN